MGFKDLLFGRKEEPQFAAPKLPTELIKVQRAARNLQYGGLKGLSKVPVEKIAGQEVEKATRGLIGQREDARRRLQSMLARRGLGATSVGMGAMTGLERDTARDIQETRLSLPERIRQLQMQRIQAASGALQAPGYVPQAMQVDTQRRGGLLPLLGLAGGAALGGALGGSRGALAGGQIGAGTGQMLTQSRL